MLLVVIRRIKNSNIIQHLSKRMQNSRMLLQLLKILQRPHAASSKHKRQMTLTITMTKSSNKKSKKKRSHRSQLMTRLQSCWQGRTQIKMVPQSAPIAEVSEARIMVRRRTWSTIRRASRRTSLKCVTMRCSYSRAGHVAAPTYILGIKCAHAASATSIRYP